MKMVNLGEAKTKLTELVERAEKGERVILARRNQPVVELRALAGPRKTKRAFGLCRGQFVVPDDFDAPLPEDIIASFEGKA